LKQLPAKNLEVYKPKDIFVDNRLIMNVKIPLLGRKPFHLFRVIPIPFKNKND